MLRRNGTSYRLADVLGRLAARAPRRGDARSLAEAAVAVLLRDDPAGAEVLIVRRAERAGDPWSGHFGLPGGRREPADADLLATARRETREEIGVELDFAAALEGLDDHVPQSPQAPRLLVRPYAFAIESAPRLALSRELADAFWVPLATLAANPSEIEVEWLGARRRMPAWSAPGGRIWGMTYRILAPLVGHPVDAA